MSDIVPMHIDHGTCFKHPYNFLMMEYLEKSLEDHMIQMLTQDNDKIRVLQQIFT